MKEFFERWKTDYDFKTIVGTGTALIMTIAFALYNGYLGIRYSSMWYGTICAYFILLLIMRNTIFLSRRKYSTLDNWERIRKRIYLAEAIVLFVLNLSLIVPIALMVLWQKPVNMTAVPAIATAVFTTYKVILAAANLKWRKKSSDSLIRFLRTLNFIDALVSVLTLQNTLIMVFSNDKGRGLFTLTTVTSGIIWLAIVIISISVLVNGIRALKQPESEEEKQ